MDKNVRKQVGDQIILIRKEKGLSQRQVALKAGIIPQNMARIEQGRYSVGMDIIGKIANALGCELKIEPISGTEPKSETEILEPISGTEPKSETEI